MRKSRTVLLLLSFALTVLPVFAGRMMDGVVGSDLPRQATHGNAPDLTGAVGWLNTNRPITLDQLKGKVVLLDFWTFCCINCMHVLPDLHKLEEKYKNELVVIGIHSAKFDNEKDTSHIRDAILRYDIRHPVANDARFAIWQAYGVQAWPTLIVISPDGNIVARYAGEGHYNELDNQIGSLIEKYRKQGQLNTSPISFSLEQKSAPSQALLFPGKVLVDSKNKRLFISDAGHNRIIVCGLNGKINFAIGDGKPGLRDGAFNVAEFRHPQGLALINDFLYVADTENHAIRQINLTTRKTVTLAGDGRQGRYAPGYSGPLRATRLNSPWDLTVVGQRLFMAMAGAHQIWWLDPSAKTTGVLAGTGQEGLQDGSASDAWFAQPSGITSDGKQLFVADSEASAVRSITLDDNPEVNTIIGHGLFDFGDRDGDNSKARLQHPLGVAFADGVLYVADSYNHKVKQVDLKSKIVTSLFGTGKAGKSDGNVPEFSEPSGLAAAGHYLYVADTNNSAIRIIDLSAKQVRTLSVQ